jgi:MoaA/NifB/PqqE/SkfB family radical SAM enzyme
VGSNPRVERRSIEVGRFERLVEDAKELGFRQLYLTGGETFLLPELGELLEISVPNIPTTVLTNATLFKGKRREVLERFAREPNFSLQVSVDGGIPELHDAHRGPGSWKRAMEGIGMARSLGVRVRIGTTETPENRAGVPVLREMLQDLGIAPEDHVVRPLIKRGESESGMEIEGSMLVPELTVCAEGVAWHPAGVNDAGITDLLVSREIFPLRRSVEYAVEHFLEYRQLDGSLPRAYHCA